MRETREGLRSYFRPHLNDLQPYVPVETLQAVADRLRLPPTGISKLDFNENPYGPSPLVHEALASLEGAHLYPDPLASELRSALSTYTGVDVARIFVGAGEDELIFTLAQLFIEPGDRCIESSPTYTMYAALTRQCAGEIVQAPLGERWELDVLAILDAITPAVKLIWVCSPNNPTGNTVTEAELRPILDTGVPVAVDEAYYEFSGKTFAPLLDEYPNLIILRTFSKLHGLAGLRVGYMLASEEVVAQVMKIKLPFNVTAAGQVAALAALDDTVRIGEQVRLLTSERDRMAALLGEHGELIPYPSEANFLLCRVRSGDARALRAELADRGVFVRHIGKPRVENCLRITTGTPADTDRLVSALHELRPSRQEARA